MRRLAVALLAIASVLLLARGAVPCDILPDQPSCLVSFLPGPTRNTFELIDIADADTSDSAGELLLTTVLVDSELSLTEWLDAIFDDTVATFDRDLLFPPGTDEDEVDRQNAFLMQSSQLEAKVAALRALGHDVSDEPVGLSVGGLADVNNISEGDLEPGDLLVAVEGEPIATIDDILGALDGAAPGDIVEVTRQRGDEEPTTVDVELVEDPEEPGRPLIGILLANEYDLPFDIDIDAGAIGGPSAGLMFALSIVDSLTPDDLTGGSVIAGTGTIGADGNVGAIGGIQQKIIGALNRGDDSAPATVFLVPDGNFTEARRARVPAEVLLVPVRTLNDALAALASLRGGDTPVGAVAIGSNP